ncbi:Dihydroflavonol 4-reductase [Trichinella spiralis]|uniref:Dihydroflavonol 4-reductase n=1 Tax=Trichinella spiralis TaxID=6334 RepID=A0ABR3L2F1_TRISP
MKEEVACSGVLGDQALKVRILHISRHQKPVHDETSSTLLSFLQRSLLLRQSGTALLPRIFSSFLLQDLLLIPTDPQFSICNELTCLNSLQLLFLLYSHWFTGMPLLHKRAHVLEVMNLMKTLSVDCCVSRGYASVVHIMCHEFIGSIQIV